MKRETIIKIIADDTQNLLITDKESKMVYFMKRIYYKCVLLIAPLIKTIISEEVYSSNPKCE
jgi:hypothetical protein